MELKRSSNVMVVAAAAVAAFVLVACLLATPAQAYPRTRTVKDHRRGYGSIHNAIRWNKPTCESNMACGWAQYKRDSNSALRPVLEYTKNRLCECSPTTQCTFRDNRSFMDAFIYYCQPAQQGARRFPGTT